MAVFKATLIDENLLSHKFEILSITSNFLKQIFVHLHSSIQPGNLVDYISEFSCKSCTNVYF
jgi:hypothetical protein